MRSPLWVEAALCIRSRSYRSFILNLIILWVVLNFRERFTLWSGFCILGLRLQSERRLRLNLHSMVLRDVVTLWVGSVFILDRNEGFAFFPGYSSWFSQGQPYSCWLPGQADVRSPQHIFQGGQILHTWIVSGVAGNFSPLDEIPPGKNILVTISPREEQPKMLFPRGEFWT